MISITRIEASKFGELCRCQGASAVLRQNLPHLLHLLAPTTKYKHDPILFIIIYHLLHLLAPTNQI